MADYPFDYQEVRKLTPEQLFQVIDDWLNCGNSGISNCLRFEQALSSTHRTLQQLFVGMMLKVLYEYGRRHATEWSYDLRNEDAVMACRDIVKHVDNGEVGNGIHFRYI